MSFSLPKLPYEYNSLEPYIDAQTMEIHHKKHHQAYIDKLNSSLKGTKFENKDINQILKDIEQVPENIRTAVINNGGGHANHTLFWQLMTPKQCSPSNNFQKEIEKVFGSFIKFKEEFTNSALAIFGSGWAWLVLDKKKLKIISTPNQDSPLMDNQTPILGLDIWEHAYYLKYQNRRLDYISAWWNIINWKKVEEFLENNS
ncbi:MAG: superoxide dismutase [Candidatus Pacearchaeota archaeon]